MIKLLYIGNNLASKTSNLSSIQSLGALFEKDGIEVFYASSKTNKVFRMLDMIKACLFLSKKVDFVLIDTYSTYNFYYAYVISQLCRWLNLKYVPILHGGNLPDRLKRNPKLSNRVFNNSYKNVSPSLYMKEEFIKQGYRNIVFIPNPIEIDKYNFKERLFKTVNLLWVRSFSKIYNPGLAVQVLAELKKRGIEAKLCMVGPDSDGSMETVKQLVKLLSVEVIFTGKLTKEAWIDLSKDYNIFLNTTNYDNMPVSVIEAMSLGLCVVSTNVGGLPYLISEGEDGFLVPPNNSISFANAIKKVMDNPSNIKEMTLKAREKVEGFDWQIVKQKWLEVLR